MTEVSQVEVPAAGWRLKLGVALFGLSIVLPVVGVPLLAGMELSAATVATVSGGLLGGAEVLGILAVAVLGGDFWDKLRALFIHGAKAVLPKTSG